MKTAVDEALRRYYSRPDYDSATPLPDQAQLDVQPPITCYVFSTEDYLAGQGLKAAKFYQYIYYIKSSNKIVGEIGLAWIGGNNVIAFRGQAYAIGAHELATMAPYYNGLAKAETLAQVKKGSFELRLLILPADRVAPMGRPVETSVMWLKSDATDGDLIYTYPQGEFVDVPSGLQPSTVYTVAEVLKAIRPAVQKLQDNPPTRPGIPELQNIPPTPPGIPR